MAKIARHEKGQRAITRRKAVSILGTGALAAAGLSLVGFADGGSQGGSASASGAASGSASGAASASGATSAAASAASAAGSTAATGTGKVEGQKWIDSDIIGNVTADMPTDPTDDFALYVNRDWASTVVIPANFLQMNIITVQQDSVKNQVIDLIENGEATSHEAELVKQFYSDETDMDARNAAGIEPARPYFDKIMAIKSLDDLSAYIEDQEQTTITSSLFQAGVQTDFMDSSKYAVILAPDSLVLDDAAEYATPTDIGKRKLDASRTEFIAYFKRFDMDEDEAGKRYDALIDLETKLAATEYTTAQTMATDYIQKVYNPMSTDDLTAIAGPFPVVEALKIFTDVGVDTFLLTTKDWLAKLGELYTEENVEAFKDSILYHLMYNTDMKLDQQCLDMADANIVSVYQMPYTTDVKEHAYNDCSTYLNWAIAKMYIEGCFDPSIKEDVTKLVEDLVATFRKRIEAADWLSDTTCKYALDKIDNVKIRVAYPDDWTPYEFTDLSFTSKDDGGSFVQDYLSITLYLTKQALTYATGSVDKTKWTSPSQTVNCFYNRTENSINICAGYLGGEYYDPDWSEAAKIGSLCTTIAHEITHGFDSGGSQFDKDGNMSNWWTDEDLAAFNERTGKVADYFSTFEPISGLQVDGSLVVVEAVADLGGMATALDMAKTIDNFDYDAFFKAFANNWKEQQSATIEQSCLMTDGHPLNYLRCNVNPQQFQEFYDTYSVTEGDNMYLAPEDRLAVW